MKIISFPKYTQFFQAVIDWNIAAGNPPTRTEEQYEMVKNICREELKETVEAIVDQDEVETIDGIVDVFVTCSYMAYLNEGFFHSIDVYDSEDVPFSTIECLPHLDLMDCFLDTYTTSHNQIQALIAVLIKRHGVEKVESFFQEVIDSNNSKFILAADYEADPESYLKAAQEKYKGQYENIVAIPSVLGQEAVYVLRANGGTGKILKPYTFKEPVFSI